MFGDMKEFGKNFLMIPSYNCEKQLLYHYKLTLRIYYFMNIIYLYDFMEKKIMCIPYYYTQVKPITKKHLKNKGY